MFGIKLYLARRFFNLLALISLNYRKDKKNLTDKEQIYSDIDI